MISRNLTGISTNVYVIIKTAFNLVTKRALECLSVPQNPVKTCDVSLPAQLYLPTATCAAVAIVICHLKVPQADGMEQAEMQCMAVSAMGQTHQAPLIFGVFTPSYSD